MLNETYCLWHFQVFKQYEWKIFLDISSKNQKQGHIQTQLRQNIHIKN